MSLGRAAFALALAALALASARCDNTTCMDRSSDVGSLCLQRIVRCTLPSLPEGDWPLVLPGNQTRLIRVREGGLSNCRLPAQ